MDDKEATNPPKVIHATANIALAQVTVTANATSRTGFSVPHLQAAEHFAEQLKAHEDANRGAGLGDHYEQCRWYASAAILLSFSAVEAALDESEDDLSIPAPLLAPLQKAPFWDRVGAVLAYVEAEQMDKGSEPAQSTDLLRALRNGLAHPKAEWLDALESHKSLTARITGARLPLSPFFPDKTRAFPLGCMSAGVADWSAKTARAFIVEFRKRCSLPTAHFA